MPEALPEPPTLPPAETAAAMLLRALMSANGRKGGKSTSPRKLQAIAGNLLKARAARWAGRRKVKAG
jgi:hypothetical protein